MGEIGGPADVLEGGVALEIGLEGDGARQLAGADQFRGDVIDAGVDGLEEMVGLEKGRHPVAGVVVDQNGAEQRLFRLEIVRGHAVGILFAAGRDRPQV